MDKDFKGTCRRCNRKKALNVSRGFNCKSCWVELNENARTIAPEVSKHFSKLGKLSWAAREKRILEKPKGRGKPAKT